METTTPAYTYYLEVPALILPSWMARGEIKGLPDPPTNQQNPAKGAVISTMTPETGNEKFAKRVDEFNKSDASLEMPKSDVRQELTYGQKAVGLTFNPGGSAEVNQIKRLCAAVIDELNSQREEAKMQNNGEKIAQFTLAIRDIQSGKMWGVNAATWQY